MSNLTITITIDIPDDAKVRVGGGEGKGPVQLTPPVRQAAPAAPQTAQDAPLPPWPGDQSDEPSDLRPQAAEAFSGMANPEAVLHEPTNAEWPAGKCPRHDRTWLNGARGLYCPAKADSPPANAKGYCTLMPGQVWNGRRIPGGP